MTNHVRDLQIFYDDEIGSLNELRRFPMQPSVARVGDLTVYSGHLR